METPELPRLKGWNCPNGHPMIEMPRGRGCVEIGCPHRLKTNRKKPGPKPGSKREAKAGTR